MIRDAYIDPSEIFGLYRTDETVDATARAVNTDGQISQYWENVAQGKMRLEPIFVVSLRHAEIEFPEK